MELSFLDKLDIKTQDNAYDMYIELQQLKDREQIEIPETLLSHIANLLENYNVEILKNTDQEKTLKSTTDLLKKEIQKRIHFEEQYKEQLKINKNLTTESDKQLQIHKTMESDQNNKIKTLDSLNSELKEELKKTRNNLMKTMEDLKNVKEELKRTKQEVNPIHITHQQVNTAINTAISNINSAGPSIQNHEVSRLEERTPTAPATTNDHEHSQESNAQNDVQMKNLFVIGDSQCRDMQSCIKKFVKPDCRVNCISNPGKTLGFVIDAIKPSKLSHNTQICIFAGTNDVFRTNFDDLTRSLQKLYNKCKQFKVLIILIPPRYDRRHMNPHIVKLNSKLKHLIASFENFDHIDLYNFIQLTHISDDGLHLNLKGKNLVSRKIATKIFGRIFINKNFNNHGNKVRYNKTYRHQTRHDGDYYNQSYRVPSQFTTQQCSHETNLPCLLHSNFVEPEFVGPPTFNSQTFPPLPHRPPLSFPPIITTQNNPHEWNPPQTTHYSQKLPIGSSYRDVMMNSHPHPNQEYPHPHQEYSHSLQEYSYPQEYSHPYNNYYHPIQNFQQ
ncbi:hypothetical protein M8J77_009027 [Diaphorina citri]|nr:hypothetical protein M8J77_009027 [Diaphorina citri]